MKGMVSMPFRKACRGKEIPVSSCTPHWASSDSDMVCSSRDDSDSSDCTCDIDNLTQEEDSGRFSADFSCPTTSPIIAPPSPFVTRTVKTTQSRPAEDKDAIHTRKRDQSLKKGALLHAVLRTEGEITSHCDPKTEVHSDQIKRTLPSSASQKEFTPISTIHGTTTTAQSTTHSATKIPICRTCVKKDKILFNTDCESCWAFFKTKEATPSHVFAILRLWILEVQKNIESLVKMALLLGCGFQDRDAVTDMTLLHYAVKAGTHGIGDPLTALRVVSDLIKGGADPRQRCKWTSMTALHYAAYFDVPEALEFILRCPDGVPIDDPCHEYSNGTSLHIAAANLSEGAFKVLLRHGACPWIRDSLGRTPHECIPSPDQYKLVPGLQEIIFRMQRFLLRQRGVGASLADSSVTDNPYGIPGRAILKAIGLKIGDRVLVAGMKTAILKYAGPTEFATGLWAGVELESPDGRHDGTVKGVIYFRCAKNYGLFVPINRLTKIPNLSPSETSSKRESRLVKVSKARRGERLHSTARTRSLSLPPGRVNHGKVDVSKVASKVAQDIRNDYRKIVLGDRVCVSMGMDALGVVRFTGGVHFASGFWIGVELDEPIGSNDGSVCGTRYFLCRRQHGIFAVPSRVTKINDNCEETWNNGVSMERERSTSITSHLHSTMLGSGLHDSFTSSSSSSSSPFLLGEEGIVPSSLHRIALYPTNTSMSNLNRCFSGRYISSRKRQQEIQRQKEEKAKEPQWQEPPVRHDDAHTKRILQKETPRWLEVGQTVFYRNRFGVIRFIGRVHFAEGTWLGMELREKSGRHDGTVKGVRYFTCRKGYGVMVTPSKVSVHGLNGAQLIKPEGDEEEEEGDINDIPSSPDAFLLL